MAQHLSLDVETGSGDRPRTIADLCRRVTDTSGLPGKAYVTFQLNRGRLRSVGVELTL